MLTTLILTPEGSHFCSTTCIPILTDPSGVEHLHIIELHLNDYTINYKTIKNSGPDSYRGRASCKGPGDLLLLKSIHYNHPSIVLFFAAFAFPQTFF
jgi:hypothetical protein